MKVSRSIRRQFSHELHRYVKLPAKQYQLAVSYSHPMDVISTRRTNFRALVDARIQPVSAGSKVTKKDVAISFDLAPSFLSQLYGGKKMGDEVARKLEVTIGLPHGWMDVSHDTTQAETPQIFRVSDTSTPYLPSHALRPTAATLASAIALTSHACSNLDLPFDPTDVDDADLVLLAVDYLQARDESTVTVSNVVDFTQRLRQKIRGMKSEYGTGSTGSTGRSAG